MSRSGILREIQEKIGIDGNISVFEWGKKPGTKENLEEITQKTYRKWLESERDISDLSYQLEKQCGISPDEQNVGDKRRRKWAIEYIENYWKYVKAGRNGKIKGKTIEQFLGGNWKDIFQSREEKEEIIEERNRIVQAINEFADK